MCKDIQNIKDMLLGNINIYNDELFELENEVKRINSKIIFFKNAIYNSIIKSDSYKQLMNNIKNENHKCNLNKYNVLIKIKNKELYRKNINTNRLKKIKPVKM